MAPQEFVDGADGEALATLAEKALSEFSQGDVGCLLYGVHEKVGLCFDTPGAVVAATGFCLGASGTEVGLHPSHGAGGTVPNRLAAALRDMPPSMARMTRIRRSWDK